MRKLAYTGLIVMSIGLLVLLALGIYYRQQWSWLVIPTWITAVATLGLLVGAVATAVYAQKTFAGQAEELREQRAFNGRQIEFNEKAARDPAESAQARTGSRSAPTDTPIQGRGLDEE